MILILVLADDFTGALDTGVQFAAKGIETHVVVGEKVDFAACPGEVLVLDTETRHLPAAEAYALVKNLTARALAAGVAYLYKKTDSALRGNIGAELAAVLDASECRQLPFLPAFPQMNRVTKNGIHYIDGVPVTRSPFGADPFAPVTHATVTELLAEQTAALACSYSALQAEETPPQEPGILVFDAESTGELTDTGTTLYNHGLLKIMAGCAGFAAVLPELLGLTGKAQSALPELDPRLLVVCGSVNPITLAQLNTAEAAGFSRLRLTPRQKLEPDYWPGTEGQKTLTEIEAMLAANPRCIIETNDAGGNGPTAEYAKTKGVDLKTLRRRVAGGLGQLVAALFPSPEVGTLLLTGGDTLLQCMNCLNLHELKPICELANGVVLASFTYNGHIRHVITKSGGFGQESILVDLAARITRQAAPTQYKEETT